MKSLNIDNLTIRYKKVEDTNVILRSKYSFVVSMKIILKSLGITRYENSIKIIRDNMTNKEKIECIDEAFSELSETMGEEAALEIACSIFGVNTEWYYGNLNEKS